MKAPIDGEEFRPLSDVKTAVVESKAPDLPKTKDDTPDSDKWADHSALDTPPHGGRPYPRLATIRSNVLLKPACSPNGGGVLTP